MWSASAQLTWDAADTSTSSGTSTTIATGSYAYTYTWSTESASSTDTCAWILSWDGSVSMIAPGERTPEPPKLPLILLRGRRAIEAVRPRELGTPRYRRRQRRVGPVEVEVAVVRTRRRIETEEA